MKTGLLEGSTDAGAKEGSSWNVAMARVVLVVFGMIITGEVMSSYSNLAPFLEFVMKPAGNETSMGLTLASQPQAHGSPSRKSVNSLDDFVNTSLFQNQHYCRDNHGMLVFCPVAPQCHLPVPQPFYLDVALTVTKSMAVGYALRIDLSKPATKTDWYIATANFAYQFGLLPFSIVVVIAKVLVMGPFSSVWDHFQCFNIAMVEGPWVANGILLCGAMITASATLEELNDGGNGSKAELGAYKKIRLNKLLMLTLAAGFCLVLPALLTNALEGLLLFSPVAFTSTLLSGGILKMINQGNSLNEFSGYALRGIKENGVSPGTLLMSSAVASYFSITLQLLTILTAYFYGGMPWRDCIWVTLMDRQIVIYGHAFVGGVLLNVAGCSQLLNQVI